jgi:hypothetical protein
VEPPKEFRDRSIRPVPDLLCVELREAGFRFPPRLDVVLDFAGESLPLCIELALRRCSFHAANPAFNFRGALPELFEEDERLLARDAPPDFRDFRFFFPVAICAFYARLLILSTAFRVRSRM